MGSADFTALPIFLSQDENGQPTTLYEYIYADSRQTEYWSD